MQFEPSLISCHSQSNSIVAPDCASSYSFNIVNYLEACATPCVPVQLLAAFAAMLWLILLWCNSAKPYYTHMWQTLANMPNRAGKNRRTNVLSVTIVWFLLYVGSAGADHLTKPFKVAEIRQRTPLAGAANVITVKLELFETLGAGTTITISGLDNGVANSPLTLTSITGDVCAKLAGASCAATWQASSGSLSVTIAANATLLLDTPYEFSFPMTNPAAAQGASTVKISSPGYETRIMSSPVEDLQGVPGGQAPLLTIIPSLNAVLSQSTPLAGELNNITLTMRPNIQVSGGTKITVSGLIGIRQSQGSSLVLAGSGSFAFCNPNMVLWDVSIGAEVRFEVCSSASMKTTKDTVIYFQVFNPPQAQAAPTATITATGAISFAPKSVGSRGGLLLGVPGGEDAFKIVLPQFQVKLMQQSTPVATSQNTLTISLRTNVELRGTDGSQISIQNLVGITAPDGAMGLTYPQTTPDVFCSATWNSASANTLTVNICLASAVVAGRDYVLSFTITNPGVDQAAPAISISATGSALIDASPVDMPGTALLSFPAGSDPLRIARPTFSVFTMAQATMIPFTNNTLTVTMRMNMDLTILGVTGITIRGMSGFASIEPLRAIAVDPVSANARALLCGTPDGDQVNGAALSTFNGIFTAWLCPGQSLVGGTDYAFSFSVTNAYVPQSAPSISVQASGSVQVALIPVQWPAAEYLGVTEGAAPLLIQAPVITALRIGQSTPLSKQLNTISVTLSSNITLRGVDDLEIIITGLSSVAGQTEIISLAGPASNAFCSDAGQEASGSWNSSDLVLPLCFNGTLVANKNEVFRFNVTNPAAAQASPSITVFLRKHASSVLLASKELVPTNAALMGVANGLDPLTVVHMLSMDSITPASVRTVGGDYVTVHGKGFSVVNAGSWR